MQGSPSPKDLTIPALTRESFLRELATNLAMVNEALLGQKVAKDYVCQVGLCMGASMEERYREALGIVADFNPEEYAGIIVDLKNRIGGSFRVIEVAADRVVVGSHTCPFEDLVQGSPSLCQMTSSVFGGIAARNFGYAKVVVEESQAGGSPRCRVTIHLGPGARKTPEPGDEYDREGSQVSPRFSQHLLLPQVLRSMEELLDRKSLEIREREQRYRLLFNQIPEAVWVYDTDTLRFLDVNQTALERYGFTREEFTAMEITRIRPPEDLERFLQVLENRNKDKSFHPEGVWRHLRKDGSLLWVEVSSQPVVIDGRDARLVIAKDITEKKKAGEEKDSLREQLAQAQKMEALGTLAGGIAHDFNNLLTGILGYTSLMLSEIKESERFYSEIRTVHASAIRASELTKELLGFARKGKFRHHPVCANEAVQAALKLIEHTFPKIVRVETSLAPDLRTVEADPSQIEHCLMNLCINAQEAMPEGGVLKIRTENRVLSEADLQGRPGVPPGPFVEIKVSDTGVGMEEDTLHRVFEPFFTTRRDGKGTGLGLSMVYGIVQNHGGFVDVSSTPAKGATFRLYLPAGDRTCSRAGERPARPLQGGTEGVLIVDDEPSVVQLADRILTSLGYRTLTARNGEEACRLYQEQMGRIDLVLLDYVMPGMSGEETYESLREIHPGVRVLLSSGYSQEGKPQSLLDRGVQGFIQKPYVMQDLAAAVRAALDRSP